MSFLSPSGCVLAIIGPSGSGKSSVVKVLADKGIVDITPTWTTRLPRPDENNYCPEHKFVSEEDFDKMDKSGGFLGVVRMFGLSFRYGLPRIMIPPSGKVPLVMLRAGLISLFAKHYSNFKIYQIEDSLKRVEERVYLRKKLGENLGSRLAGYEEEIVLGRRLAHRIFNNSSTIDKLVKQIEIAVREDFPSRRSL